MKSDEAIKKQEFADTLPRASIQDLGMILMGDGFEVRISILLLCVCEVCLGLVVVIFSVGLFCRYL